MRWCSLNMASDQSQKGKSQKEKYFPLCNLFKKCFFKVHDYHTLPYLKLPAQLIQMQNMVYITSSLTESFMFLTNTVTIFIKSCHNHYSTPYSYVKKLSCNSCHYFYFITFLNQIKSWFHQAIWCIYQPPYPFKYSFFLHPFPFHSLFHTN